MTTPLLTQRGDDRVGSDAAEEFVHRHPWVISVGRAGWFAKGLVYGLVGVLAFTIVAHPNDASDGEANQTGAVAKIAQQPFGAALLWIVAFGLFIYAGWRLVTVVLPADTDGHAVLKRVAYVVSAIVYVVLGLTAISLARQPGTAASSSTEGEDARIEGFTRDVMSWTGGRSLVALLGLLVIGIGAYFLYKAVSGSFEKELEHRAIGPFSWDAIRGMGRAGWIGRAAMMSLIGFFLVRAAWRFDPSEARGLDDSLRRVADDSLGMVLVVIVAIGLVLYGAFCIVTVPSQKLVATDDRTVAS